MRRATQNSSQQGFSLIEVMIALTLFAFFVTAFLTSQGFNVNDSTLNREQLMLQSLAERKINELIMDPPKFSSSDNNSKNTKTFEETEFQNYEYTIELKKLTIPDFGQLLAKGNAGEEATESYEGDYYDQGNNSSRNAQIEKMIFDEMKKNIEKILWQARVTITNKETKYSFTLSTYLTNYNEKVELNVGI